MTETTIATVDNMLHGSFDFHDHKIRTAYALNLCTVSVSQIIDYEDLIILEQEYDAILNNLNIESLPADEALLAILKQLLDTITFFRIEEGEKALVEKEYQHKMKNAIWNAVPNMGLILAGGSPLTMAISLASQIGVGYMNYRRTKAENKFAYEKQQWQLKRAAIEQFNGLRRELFDTAWRLVNAHDIPDVYRLTERQVKQYNTILMDPDFYRRYERLDTIKENFVAYPPFWYFFGNTANALSQRLEGTASEYYRNAAKQYFEIFVQAFSACNLLRENQVASACALEYIDLLDPNRLDENHKIRELLQFAVKMSGNANDVLQLCAFAYLKAGDSLQAAKLFRRLVNEDYNTTVNAQLLSSYYVSAWLSGSDLAETGYNYLQERVDVRYLYPFPQERPNLKDAYQELHIIQEQFAENQKEILQKKYELVIDQFKDQYTIRFNRCIPAVDGGNHPDSYYNGSQESLSLRKEETALLQNKNQLRQYQYILRDLDYPNNCLAVLNDMLNDVNLLTCIQGQETALQQAISQKLLAIRGKLYNLMDAVQSDNKFSVSTCKEMLDISFDLITEDFFTKLKDCAEHYVNQKKTITELNDAEVSLREFCTQQGFKTPDVLFDTANDLVETAPVRKKYLSLELITEGITPDQVNEKFKTTEETIRFHSNDLCKPNSSVRLIMHDEEEFDSYCVQLKIPNKADYRRKMVAVLDDTSSRDNDLIFTTEGIMQVVRGKMQKPMSYDNLSYNYDEKKVFANQPYTSDDVNMHHLIQLLMKLRTKPYVEKEKKKSFWMRGK